MPVYGNQSYSFRTQLYSPMGFSFKKKIALWIAIPYLVLFYLLLSDL